MGKQKGTNKHKAVKNVFKVAGAKSLKLKHKAKAVSGQLKKLNEMNRKKTEEVDGQLADLRTQLLQNVSSEGEEKNKKCAVFIKETKPDIEPVASETLTKLCEMQM